MGRDSGKDDAGRRSTEYSQGSITATAVPLIVLGAHGLVTRRSPICTPGRSWPTKAPPRTAVASVARFPARTDKSALRKTRMLRPSPQFGEPPDFKSPAGATYSFTDTYRGPAAVRVPTVWAPTAGATRMLVSLRPDVTTRFGRPSSRQPELEETREVTNF
jgi:hypothetical protein